VSEMNNDQEHATSVYTRTQDHPTVQSRSFKVIQRSLLTE